MSSWPTDLALLLGALAVGTGLALLRAVWKAPLEATGLAYLPQNIERFFSELGGFGLGVGIVRIEGSGSALQEKRSNLQSTLNGRRLVEAHDGSDMFRKVNSGTSFVDTMEDVWLVSLPQPDADSIAMRLSSHWIADWAGGKLWSRCTPGYDGTWMREALLARGGRATLVRASKQTRIRVPPFTSESPTRSALTKTVKAAFDPLRLFNPGRIWEGV